MFELWLEANIRWGSIYFGVVQIFQVSTEKKVPRGPILFEKKSSGGSNLGGSKFVVTGHSADRKV